MALIKCKYCGHPVSDKAVKCPKCGGDLTQTEEPKQEVEVRETNTIKITDSPQLPYSVEPQQPKKGNGLKILLVILAVIAVGGIGYFLYWNNQQTELKAAIEAAQQDSIAAAQLLAAQEAARLDSIRQDSIEHVNNKVSDILKATNLVKYSEPYVVFRNDWKKQILSLGFVQGDTEKFVYEGDDEQASIYGSYEITTVSEHFFLNIPNNEIEFIHAKDYEETFEIKFENPNTLLEFINSLISFGYKESRTVDGKRLFDCLKDENSPAGIGWIIDGKRVYSINSQC